MKSTSNAKPPFLRIERTAKELCDLIFCTNIKKNIVVEDDTETTEYTYDTYRLPTTYTADLYNRVKENSAEWLARARYNELGTIAAEKTTQARAACQAAIYAGVDVETDAGTEHFSLDAHDQQNLQSINSMIAAGVLKYPYHADGKECVLYDASDLKKIIAAANEHIKLHTTYCNLLRTWIKRETDYEVLKGIRYGAELPADLREYLKELTGKNNIRS